MKLKFKVQPYQTDAVRAVIDCFAGQPKSKGPSYRVDPGISDKAIDLDVYHEGFRNAALELDNAQMLNNIHEVQQRQNLPLSESLNHFTILDNKGQRRSVTSEYTKQALAATSIHLDIEMETGTGKTYCYIKTIFEMHQRYGWSKFIIMVPSIAIRVRYDLVGKVSEDTKITRATAAKILRKIRPAVFQQFKENPEHFISEASRIINEQKAATVIEDLVYDKTEDRYDTDIFVADQVGKDFSRAIGKLKNHIYDYAVTDSDVERGFVKELDTSSEIIVYAKLPRGFLIPTPVGDYNPDWAISFKQGSVRHIYFVAETKGTMSSMELRGIEGSKIKCARKFFERISKEFAEYPVKYDVVTNYDQLLGIVRPTE